MAKVQRLTIESATELVRNACLGVGTSISVAQSLAEATISGELFGKTAISFGLLPDYLESFVAGRILARAEPAISFRAPALIESNAMGGIAQLGFDRAFKRIARSASRYGIALFTQHNSYTTGELGYYVRRLTEIGLVGLAATNGSTLMAAPGAKKAVYCTNPIAFGAPGKKRTLLIDQASSATAFINVRLAAERNEVIPEGWAIDAKGKPTTKAREAARGALLPFGGTRGANIALMVEVLAAGVTGANWSLDCPPFLSGKKSPGAGLLVVAVAPWLVDQRYAKRLDQQITRLENLGVHIPGVSRPRNKGRTPQTRLSIPTSLIERIERFLPEAQPSKRAVRPPRRRR